MTPLKPLLLLLLLQLSSSFTRATAAEDTAAVESIAEITLDALSAAVDFAGENADTVNLDGVIGLRSVEGQSNALLARYWSRMPAWLAARLTDLRDRAGQAAQLGVRTVRAKTPVYFANAGNMIAEHSWDTFYPSRPLRQPAAAGDAAESKNSDELNEKFSDDCIREFYGPKGSTSAASSAKGCAISERCWQGIVMPRGKSGYFLTHQLFYLLNGIQANCLSNLTAQARAHPPAGTDGSLPGIFDDLCARIFVEAQKLESAGLPKPDRDLFMEQIGLCGLAGFPEFAQWRWLPLLLSWQRPSGCFGQFAGEVIDPRNFQLKRYGNYRRKRVEMRMPSGCLSHRTSVAMDALMAYCRRAIETLAA